MHDDTIRFTFRMEKKTHDLISALYPQDNCRSQNEFIGKAIEFYIGYLSHQIASEFLSQALVANLQATISGSEERIWRMLFKLTTELGVLTRIIATYEGLDEYSLPKLRGQVVDDLKHTNGTLHLDAAIRDHKSKF